MSTSKPDRIRDLAARLYQLGPRPLLEFLSESRGELDEETIAELERYLRERRGTTH